LRYLLALLIFFLTTIDVFGWTLSLAPGLSVKNAILYLILLTLSARFVVRGGLRLELPQLHLWFAVLIAYATLSWLIVGVLVQYKFYTLLGSGIDLKAELLDNAMVFAVYLYGTRTLQDAKFLLKCILLTVTAANAIAIGNVAGLFEIGITPIGTEGNLTGRVFGAFGHANETAALIVCLLPAYVAAAFSSRGMARVFWALAGSVSATLMIMTGSRGAFVGLALAAVFASYLCRRIISWRRAATLVVILGAVAVPVLALASVKFGGILTERVTELILSPATSSDERLYIWRPILDKMMANPVTLVTGFGWDSYNVMGFFYNVHNHYLALWFELGIIGLASYLLVIAQLLVTARRAAEQASDETARYLIAFIYGIIGLSGAVFFSQLFKPWLYIWIYSGLTMRMAVIALQAAHSTAPNKRRAEMQIGSRAGVTRRGGPRLPATRGSRAP
jgi:putative inorganic carbon (HCO3(-)) transporter